MADATTAPTPAPPTLPSAPLPSSRQARLDAAIAHFRSEASASGYVVEEVRLRLPVPDVDVLPRVVIAQNGANSGAPPPFPQTKQHRALPRYPAANGQAAHVPAASISISPFTRHRKQQFKVPHLNRIAPPNGCSDGSANGFKRTISGSVILNAISDSPSPPGTTVPVGDNCAGKSVSVPASPPANSTPTPSGTSPKDAPRGKFWNTVISEEKTKMDAEKNESRKDDPQSSPEQLTSLRDARAVYVRPRTDAPPSGGPESHNGSEEARKIEQKVSPPYDNDKKENRFRINQHNIPDSHVQLLLSSVADMPARAIAARRSSSPTTPSGGARTVTSLNGAVPRRGTRTAHGGRRRDSAGRAPAARPFRCAQCPSSFDREGHLRVHILAVHEKKRPFVCQVCDSAFGHSSSLLRHVRTVHQASPAVGPGSDSSSSATVGRGDGRSHDKNGDDGRHFRCSACSTAFSRVAQLNRHVATNHPLASAIPAPSNAEAKRSCRMCAQKFSSTEALVAHVKAKHRDRC